MLPGGIRSFPWVCSKKFGEVKRLHFDCSVTYLERNTYEFHFVIIGLDSNLKSNCLESIPKGSICLILTFGLHSPKLPWQWLKALSIGLIAFSGCAPAPSSLNNVGLDSHSPSSTNSRSINVSHLKADTENSSQVLAQGRLQPARGMIRISALPGDRIDEIAIIPGQSIKKGATIAKLQSFQLKSLELEAALLKLDEAKSLLEVRRKEADLNVSAAKLKQESAAIQLKQSLAQREQANQGTAQVDSLAKQIETLERLRNEPLTRAAIGSVELETRRNEFQRATSLSEQALLTSSHAVELSELQVDQSQYIFSSAFESLLLVDKSSPVASLEKQIEILNQQVRQSLLVSPIDGFVISVNAEVGERVGQLPIAEIADLSNMVCLAEVHESDVGKLALGNRVEIRSPALQRVLAGTVERIDRVVGSVQMRSPNPMARSDFRAVPVWISIDPKDVELASSRLQLQVEVAISFVQ